jgi:hypothetical protein
VIAFFIPGLRGDTRAAERLYDAIRLLHIGLRSLSAGAVELGK